MVIRPNRSLTPLGMILFLAGFFALMLVIIAGFVWAGAWLILPFAGLEVVLVAGLCRWMYQHRDDREEIEIDSEHITIIKHNGNRETQCRFQRYWVRAAWSRGRTPGTPRGLLLARTDDR